MAQPQIELWYNAFSICSSMVRNTIEHQKVFYPEVDLNIKFHHIRINKNEQLTEEYLTINPRGQVPTLIGAKSENMYDSEEIERWVTQKCPKMLPEPYKDEILHLHHTLHSINFGVLTFFLYPERGAKIIVGPDGVNERLVRPGLTENHKALLHGKIKYMESLRDKSGGFSETALIKAKSDTKEFFQKILKVYNQHKAQSGPWLYGKTGPTILDTSLLVFIQRLHDIPRTTLIPEEIQNWSLPLLMGKTYQTVTDGWKPCLYYQYLGYTKEYQLAATS